MSGPVQSLIRPVPFPNGVATAAGTAGFVSVDRTRVVGVDLESGQERWTIDAPFTPLLVVGAMLVLQNHNEVRSNAIELTLLDAAEGTPISPQLESVVLPEWVSVSDPDQDFAFDLSARDTDLVIDWRAEARYRGEDSLRDAREKATRSMAAIDKYARERLENVEHAIRVRPTHPVLPG